MCKEKALRNYLAGLTAGDGTLYYYRKTGNYYIEIYDENETFLRNVSKEIETTFKIKCNIMKLKSRNYFRLRMSNKKLYMTLKELTRKRLKNPTKTFVRGLIDAEGTVYIDNKGRIALEIGNKNYEIIKAISKFLRREKIHHTITLHREKKSIIYKIRIRGWENVEKTIEKIKPKHPKIVVKFLNLLKFKP